MADFFEIMSEEKIEVEDVITSLGTTAGFLKMMLEERMDVEDEIVKETSLGTTADFTETIPEVKIEVQDTTVNEASLGTTTDFLKMMLEERMDVEDEIVKETSLETRFGTTADFLETIPEVKIEVEDTTVNEASLGTTTGFLETIPKEKIEVEDGIVNKTSFGTTAGFLETIPEEKIEVEDGIVNETSFGKMAGFFETMLKEKIKVEDGIAMETSLGTTDRCEDSGFDTLSTFSNSSSEKVNKENEGTIGEGIQFVDPALIAYEQKRKEELKMETKKKINEVLRAIKIAEREAYDKKIKEAHYEVLMHLLFESKAKTNFITKQFDIKKSEEWRETNKLLKRKGIEDIESSPPRKRSCPMEGSELNQKYTSDAAKEKEMKSEKGNKHLINLSKEELVSMSHEQSKELLQTTDEKENSEPVTNFAQPNYFQGELRDYQKEGVNWLKVLYENGLNGILADEMGLGKTIQLIAHFAYLIEKQVAGPYLVIVPLSTLANWKTEFERFAPQLPVVVYYGDQNKRLQLKSKVQQQIRIGSFLTLPIVITTYEMPQKDTSFFRKFNWRYIVVDEAQRIKNFGCLLFRALKTFNSYNRLLMTGTPLQNNLTELWTLLNFLLPNIFNNLGVFETWFNAKEITDETGRQKFLKQEQEKNVLAALREILQPFMLRRLKEDVCPDIPPLKEVMVYSPLTVIQYDLYKAILNKDIDKLHKVKPKSVILDVDGVRPKRKCTQKFDLDQCCYDYYWMYNVGVTDFTKESKTATQMVGNRIIKTEDFDILNQFADVTEENVDYLIRLVLTSTDALLYRHVVNHPYIIHYPLTEAGDYKVDEDLIKASGKMLVLDALLKKLHRKGHKVLLFSAFQLVLDLIEDYLSLRNFLYVRMDGSDKYEDRKNNIESFQSNPEVFLFLLTTKAGGLGLNLAAADTVIIYDSDWNPQNDLQAMARCHRIGQTKPVAVYRLCTKGTIDEAIIQRANVKRVLEKAVIAKQNTLVTSEEGLSRLKRLLEEESFKVVESKKEVFTDAELDELLDRSDMVFTTKAEESMI